MRTEVATSHLSVTPGTPVVLDVEVTNTADVIDGVTASIQGLDPAWVSLVVPVVSLFPEATTTVSLKIDLPKNCLAGEYLVSVRVQSIIDIDRYSDHEFWLSVEPLLAGSIELHPSVVVAGSDALFQATLINEGNVTLDLAISALDETRELTTLTEPTTLSIPPGETHFVDIHAEGKRPWFGQALTRTVTIVAAGSDLELEAKATFTQKPRIPRGVLTALMLAAIIALWATIFLFVVDALRDTPDPTKATAENFNAGGNTVVDLSLVGVKMTGNVTAESNGAPVPRITVEAQRVARSGDLESVGSTSTGEDGSYTLESLLPGTYVLRFSGDGFKEVWYPAATNAGSAEEINTSSGEVLPLKPVVMTGQLGSLSGQVVAPESVGTGDITVTITQVPEESPEAETDSGVPPPPPTPPPPTPVDANGVFVQPDLPTPAEYQIVITSPGFLTRTVIETLGPGENKVINTIRLGAAPGSISGTVTNQANQPLGGVEVTVRSGAFQKATKTPTSGTVGQFAIEDLETPQTYVLTFTLAGYADKTVALELGSGQNLNQPVMLLGGQGTLSGVVTDTTGSLLGGTKVVVQGGGKSFETATLTESSAVGQQGSWSVTGVPTPGVYTVTASAPGFDSQTIRVVLPSAGSLQDINTVLPRSRGDVTGTVSSAGQPVADVIVELSDGSTPVRTTATASLPAGAYRFADIQPGSYTLTFRKVGLQTQVVIITVTADQIVTRDVDMAVGQ